MRHTRTHLFVFIIIIRWKYTYIELRRRQLHRDMACAITVHIQGDRIRFSLQKKKLPVTAYNRNLNDQVKRCGIVISLTTIQWFAYTRRVRRVPICAVYYYDIGSFLGCARLECRKCAQISIYTVPILYHACDNNNNNII